MVFEEEFRVQAPVERVWEFLLDVGQVAGCVPGCVSARRLDAPGRFRVEIAVRVGFIAATFTVRVELTEQRPPTYLASVAYGEERGLGSTLTQRNELSLIGEPDGGTRVRFRTDVNVLGRLGKLGQGLMRETARRMVAEFATCLRTRLEAEAVEPTA